MALRVFIGSSKEANDLGWLVKLARWIEEAGHTPVPWTSPGLFAPGDYVYDAVLNISKNVDAAILVFAEDDKVWYRQHPAMPQARDNVLIEYGVFSGVLGRNQAIIGRLGKPKTPTDLEGIVHVPLTDDREFAAMDEIGRWLRGVSQAVHARQSAPLGAPTSADSFFHTDTLDKTLLGSAAHAVYLTQETGALVTETAKHDLTRVLTAGGRVRMVVTTPTQNTASLLAFRNDNLHTVQALLARNVNFRHQLEDLLTRVGEHAERLEIRYLPYPVCSTTVIVDPEHEDLSKRRALVRYAGFQISYAEKPDFQLDGTSSPRLLDLILREFKTAFEHSSKINVITAPPRAGKTTSLQRLISQVKHDPNVFYAMTPAIWSSDVRVRFELQMSSHQDSIVFAIRKSDGDHLDSGLAEAMDKYDVRQGALDTLVSELEVAHKEGKILILDEIGPLQIQDRRFVECIRRILDDESATLFATLSTSKHEFFDAVKRHPRSTVVHVDDPSHWEAVLAQLVQELKASQKLAQLVAPRRQ